jgi:hypothetical protein
MHIVQGIFALPGERLPPLKDAHQVLRQRRVSQKERAQADFACDLDHARNLGQHFTTVLQLPDDADLHVVDDERRRLEIDRIFDCLWNAQTERMLHDDECWRGVAVNSPWRVDRGCP